jgi:ABC-type multidrug transport system ATPase subunit
MEGADVPAPAAADRLMTVSHSKHQGGLDMELTHPSALVHDQVERRGMRIDARHLSQRVDGGRTILRDVSLTVHPGQLVALAGASGSGKTTLLEALAGVRPAAQGTVAYGGVDYYAHLASFRSVLGFVPQDDIIHRELPVRRTLRYAARLRLPAGTTPAAADAAVDEVLEVLDLTARADVPVGRLSGGERKRASIAVELLTRPRLFFLDEPTSGLDPAMAADFVGHLRRIADRGTTVVFTTHNPSDVTPCDQVVFLAHEGHLAFVGSPDDACSHFGTRGIEQIYQRLAGEDGPPVWTEPAPIDPPSDRTAEEAVEARPVIDVRVGAVRQWWLLIRRNIAILASNRLTMAILVGSPVAVLLMIVVLFRPHAFDSVDPSPSATAMILFWLAFGGFFFGLTYGLLQICTEMAILRRERFVGLRVGSYLMAKLAVLLPLLAVVDAAMLAVLRATDRLPSAGWPTYGSLFVTLLLSSAAALTLGLLASAAVSEPAQATMALPMLCFPQVLFSGAILPVPIMAAVGQWLSYPMSNRWTFEGLGRGVDLNSLWASGVSPLGPPLLASYGDTFTRPVQLDWAILAGFTVIFLGWTWAVIVRKCRGHRPPAGVSTAAEG